MGRHSAGGPVDDGSGRAPAQPRPPGAFDPRHALGTPAALPPASAVPRLEAPTLRTGPVPVQPRDGARGADAGRPVPIGRLLAAVAVLAVGGVVIAQTTAERSLADVPAAPVSAALVPGSSSPSADSPAADLTASPDPTSPAPTSRTTPTPTPSAGTPTAQEPAPVSTTSSTAPSPTATAPTTGAPQDGSASPSPSSPAPGASRTAPEPTTATPTAPPSTASPTAAPPATVEPSPTATASPDPSPSADPSTASPAPSATDGGSATTVRSLRATASAAGNGDVALGAGSYRFDDFRDDLLGVHLQGDLVGAGSARTSIQMVAGSSTRASAVPRKSWSTNQLSLVKVSGASRISGFTLRGTDQGHLYNGLRISRSTGTRITDVRVVAVPGSDDIPPGETFGINDFHTDGAHYRDVEVDGNGIAGAAFGTNSSSGTVIEDSWFHDSGHANGATFWQTRDVTVRDTRSTGNHDAGFNFERVSGTVLLDHVTIRGNRLSHLRIDSDRASATYRIVDPVFDGPKLKILMTPRYMGAPNLQRRSDVHVIIGGVDRTDDVVQWVTHF